MGFGEIDCCDPDLVEDSNRNRQLFTARDVGKPKTHAVLENVAPYATGSTLLRGFHGSFQEFLLSQGSRIDDYDAVVCGVDNMHANVEVARHFVNRGTSVVFVNVSRDAEAFRIFIQRPEAACFGCYMPSALEPHRQQTDGSLKCTPDAAVGDCLMAAVAFACRAIVLEVCGLRISSKWNCRDITFYGLDLKDTVGRRADCRVCEHRRSGNEWVNGTQ